MIPEGPTKEPPSRLVSARYETIAPIGRGGMAEVFLAVTVGAGGVAKLAVLKRIWPEFARDPQFLAMFLDEARLSVRMSHPNLVQTYEVIEEDDRLAIAMEYLDGQPLGRVLNRLSGAQALSLPQRVRIVTKLLAGLDYAHELVDYDGTPLSVVHRDVSPHNVFITYDGGVKLVDFGVAKSVADAHLTRPGTIKGKFSYMAPEQFQGEAADRRTDIFSVGVILWEMLAGRRFWNGVASNQIAAHLMSDRSLPALPAELGLSVELEEICARALSRHPDERYATAAQMEADLERVVTSTHEASDRLLGKAVAEGFAVERAERQALIDRHLRKIRSGSYPLRSGSYPALGGAYPTPSTSLPPIVIPAVAAPARFPRLAAVALALALPVLVLVAVLFGRSGSNRGVPPMVASPPRAAAVSHPARTVIVTEGRDFPDLRPSVEADREPSRRSELARRDRRSTASPHRRGAAPSPAGSTSWFVPPASRAGVSDQGRAFPEARAIDTTNPYPPASSPRPRAIDTANPFLPPASPPAGREAH